MVEGCSFFYLLDNSNSNMGYLFGKEAFPIKKKTIGQMGMWRNGRRTEKRYAAGGNNSVTLTCARSSRAIPIAGR